MAIDLRERTAFGRWVLNNRWGRWMAAALLWSILGVLFALPNLSSPNWSRPLLGSLTQWWAWGLVTPLIFWTDGRLPFKEKQLGMRILAHLLASVALTILYFYAFAAMRALMGLSAWSALASERFLSIAFHQGLLWGWLVYWVIFGARQTFRYYQHYMASELRLERVERSFSQARLNSLRMQLDPHFLFNALNTISSQVERDPRLARSMIEHLGDLLRLSLEARDKQEIPLAEELAFLDHYVAIQKIRFGASLRIETRVAPERIAGLHPNGNSRFAVRRRSGGPTEVEISLPLRFTGERADDRSAH